MGVVACGRVVVGDTCRFCVISCMCCCMVGHSVNTTISTLCVFLSDVEARESRKN